MKRINKKASQTPPNRLIKIAFVVLFMLFSSCIENPEGLKKATPKIETIQLVFVADRSKSFADRYTKPNSWLFQRSCEKAAKTYTLDFRYGFVTDSSNIPLLRYYSPLETNDPNTANPWLGGENAELSEATYWPDFAKHVDAKLSEPTTQNSDVASTLNRAIICFQEYDSSTTRKILLLCTDLEDSYTKLPHIPNDIEVYTVGLLPTVEVEKNLNTKNVKRFESLEAALTAISKSIN